MSVVWCVQVVNGASGSAHWCCVCDDGSAYSWGEGVDGKLGHNDDEHHLKPKLVHYFTANDIRVTNVACGDHHTAALDTNGNVYT